MAVEHSYKEWNESSLQTFSYCDVSQYTLLNV